jgi:hypothetical protein
MNKKNPDPVKNCEVYRTIGCSFVDGLDCRFPNCSILDNHVKYGPKKKTIAFDFDGVIHKYRKGWGDGSINDELNEDILWVIKGLLEDRHKVFILSTRNKRQIKKHFDKIYYPQKLKFKLIPRWVKFWKRENVVGIANHKVVFDVCVDDRVMRFDPEQNGSLLARELINFKPKRYKK